MPPSFSPFLLSIQPCLDILRRCKHDGGMDQLGVRLTGGTFFITAEAIVQLARKKGLDLDLVIREDGLKARFAVPMGPLHVPVELGIKKLTAAEAIVAAEGLSIEASVLPVPLSLLQSFTRKYPFLALDPEHKRIFINLESLLSKWAMVRLKDARLVENGIEVEVEELNLKELQNI